MLMGLLLADLLLAVIWGMSIRGGWPDALLVLAVLFSGMLPVLTRWQQCGRWLRLYSGLYVAYAGLCVFAWFADRLFFIVVGLPLIMAFTGLSRDTRSGGAGYAIVDGQGVLSPEHYRLLRYFGPLERYEGTIHDRYWPDSCASAGSILEVRQEGAAFQVRLRQCTGDSVVVFGGE